MYACVWPSLVTNLLKFAMASVPQFESGSIVQTRTTESGGSSKMLKAVIQMDSVSFALLDGPTDTEDSVYGACVEVCSTLSAYSHVIHCVLSSAKFRLCIEQEFHAKKWLSDSSSYCS